ncbi:hypothetical protein IT396_02320 [Candidatus Nomurabacteria bacterium]|nr:hypothetical protein [Candidatus Nomurabacteria bacterium]
MSQFQQLLAAERQKLESIGFTKADTPRTKEYYGHMQKRTFMRPIGFKSTVVMDRGGELWIHTDSIDMSLHGYEPHYPTDD